VRQPSRPTVQRIACPIYNKLPIIAQSPWVHPVQISQWKKQLLDGVESLFRDGRQRERDDELVRQAELFEQIGRLNMEIEWLKKRLARCG